MTSTRRNKVSRKDAMVKVKYIEDIFHYIKNRPEYICGLYYKILFFGKMDNALRDKFFEKMELLSIDREASLKDRVVVYGVGFVGRYFIKNHRSIIQSFADKDSSKVGKRICGFDIIDLKTMKELSSNYQIVVASSIDNVYSFLATLWDIGIMSCYVYRDCWSEM